MIRRLLIDRNNPDDIAVIERGREVPYRALIQKALALQPRITQKKQRNIAIFLPNGSDYIAAFWGTLMAGKTAFPFNVSMTGHEVTPLLRQAHVETVITSLAYRGLFDEMAALAFDILYMEELCAPPFEDRFEMIDIAPDVPVLLLGTSGTTGRCKIVQLTEKNIEASAMGYLGKMCFDEYKRGDVRYILAAPFSSVYGMMILTVCLMMSFPVILAETPFTLDSLFRTAAKHKATHYEGSATTILLMEQMIGKHIPHDIRALKCFGFGGSKVSGSTIERVRGAYGGKEFFQGYGMTEAAPLITKHPGPVLKKPESVGNAIQGVEIAIATDNKIIHTPYAKGEIIIKGPNVMPGYYLNPVETKRAIRNGYLYTGDIGYLDEDGYLYVCGRKKNMLIVRGLKVYPEEIEECIFNSLLARDCVVYGQADAFGDEIVCADIVPIHSKVTQDEIRRYCADHLAQYKQPKEITFCEIIKKNASGKTKR